MPNGTGRLSVRQVASVAKLAGECRHDLEQCTSVKAAANMLASRCGFPIGTESVANILSELGIEIKHRSRAGNAGVPKGRYAHFIARSVLELADAMEQLLDRYPISEDNRKGCQAVANKQSIEVINATSDL